MDEGRNEACQEDTKNRCEEARADGVFENTNNDCKHRKHETRKEIDSVEADLWSVCVTSRFHWLFMVAFLPKGKPSRGDLWFGDMQHGGEARILLLSVAIKCRKESKHEK